MPLLGPDDPLPLSPSRVLVAGTSGSGKTTLARELSARKGLPHTEIDSLFHGPGWTPRESFLEEATAVADGDRWVSEWQYSPVRPHFLARCDLLVWLDLPLVVVMWRLVRRTVSRRVRGTELWNGNREGPLLGLFTDPEHIIRFTWRVRHHVDQNVERARVVRPELPVVRLRSPREVTRWLDRVSAPGGRPVPPR